MRKDELVLQIDQLFDLGRRTYDDLRDAEKDVLTAFLIQKSKNPWDFIAEDPCDGMLPARIATYLLERSYDHATDILASVCAFAKLAAKTRINELFEARAELEAYYNPSREMNETELMVLARNREVANDINSQLRSAIC